MSTDSTVKSPFFAIVLASNCPEKLAGFFENLRHTAHDHNAFEVLIRADKGDNATINIIKQYQRISPYRIELLVEKNVKKTYQLHKAYNKLTISHASPSVYFFANLTDEIRFSKDGWDSVIKRHIGMYDDDIFRLKISANKVRNYYNLSQAITCPDNYSVVTKRWLQITGGWGDYWGTDSWIQCVDFYLGKRHIPKIPWGIYRSVPVYDIEMEGQEAGEGYEGTELHYRARMVEVSWDILLSPEGIENFSRLATRLHAHIRAKELGLTSYEMVEDFKQKHIVIMNEKKGIKEMMSYKVPESDFINMDEISYRHRLYKSLKFILGGGFAWWILRVVRYEVPSHGSLERVLKSEISLMFFRLFGNKNGSRITNFIRRAKRKRFIQRVTSILWKVVKKLFTILLTLFRPFFRAFMKISEKISRIRSEHADYVKRYYYVDSSSIFFDSGYLMIAQKIDAI